MCWEKKEKKESVHEDESSSALTKPPFSTTGLEVGGDGGGEGFWDYEAASCPLCPIVAGTAPAETPEPPRPDRGLSHQHSHNAALAQTHK